MDMSTYILVIACVILCDFKSVGSSKVNSTKNYELTVAIDLFMENGNLIDWSV